MTATSVRVAFLMVTWAIATAARPLGGQVSPGPVNEAALMREAAQRESLGDHDGAERLLRQVLAQNASSSVAVFGLERIFRTQGRLAELVPFLDEAIRSAPQVAASRYLKLRVLVEMDSLPAAEREADRWMEAEPRSVEAYREIARVYDRVFGPERALEVLRQGRASVDEPEALAPEMGDVLWRIHEREGAAQAWAEALETGGSGRAAVLRRLDQMETGREDAGQRIVNALVQNPATPARRRIATHVALVTGLDQLSLDLGREAAAALDDQARGDFLEVTGQLAEERGAQVYALWAYQSIRSSSDPGLGGVQLEEKIATAALEAGDTAIAWEAYGRVADAFPPGSQRRRAPLATSLRLAPLSGAGDATERIGSFSREYPDAPEVDVLASGLAAQLHARGELVGAQAVLEGIEGPRSALERGYLHLARGDAPRARAELSVAASGLPVEEATEVIQMAGLLGRMSGASLEIVMRSALLGHLGRHEEALGAVDGGLVGIPAQDRAAVLSLGARLADRGGRPSEASALRRRILREFMGSSEAVEAGVWLARHTREEGGDTAGAIQLLEQLILAHPEHPVIPQARRELARLRDPAGASGRPGGSGAHAP